MLCYGFQAQLLYLYSTLVLVLYFICTAHICFLYKGTDVYSFIMKYNTNILVFLTITAVIEIVEPLLERLAVKFALEHGIIEAIFQGNLEVVIKAIKNADIVIAFWSHCLRCLIGSSTTYKMPLFYTCEKERGMRYSILWIALLKITQELKSGQDRLYDSDCSVIRFFTDQ